MWNRKLFNKIISELKKKKIIDGRVVKSKEDIYKYLAKKLFVSVDTVKGWTRLKSRGPRDPQVRKELEVILGVALWMDIEVDEMEDKKTSYSDFVKKNISECYSLMKDYLHSEDIQEEEVYCIMRFELEKKRISIPKHIFKKISNFADEYLDPIVYDYDNLFKECYTSDIGHYKDNVFQIDTEDGTMKHISRFFNKIIEIEKKLDDFAMKELYPILIQ